MSERLNTFVDFRGDFPKTDPYQAIPGEEVVDLVVTGLEQNGFPIHQVEAIDFERIIHCSSGEIRFEVYVWIDWEEMDRWEVCCPSTIGFFGRLLGRTDHSEHKQLLEALDKILHRALGVREVRWFPAFEMVGYREKCIWYPGPVVSG